VVDRETATQVDLAREFRNLIHPGRSARLAKVCDRGTALSALAAVELIVSDLCGRKSAGPGGSRSTDEAPTTPCFAELRSVIVKARTLALSDTKTQRAAVAVERWLLAEVERERAAKAAAGDKRVPYILSPLCAKRDGYCTGAPRGLAVHCVFSLEAGPYPSRIREWVGSRTASIGTLPRGTEVSNPASSNGESGANLNAFC
jgi:hypothetical protein